MTKRVGQAAHKQHADDTEGLSEVQARKQRVLGAVLQLAAEGGYDAVQLRDVSARSGVALRTIYKYFGSRAGLLSATMAQWQNRIVDESIAHAADEAFADRMVSRYRYIFDEFRRHPRLFDTLVGLQREEGGLQSFGAVPTLHDLEFESLDNEFRADFTILTGSALYSMLNFCVYGDRSFDDAWIDLERVIRRVAQLR